MQPHNDVTLNRCSTLVLKRCVRAQLTECVGIKTLSQRYMTVAYTGEDKGDQQNNLTKCFILHHYCKKHDIFYVPNVLLNDTNQIQIKIFIIVFFIQMRSFIA